MACATFLVMAKRTQITLIDDVDGELADETVQFGLDGVSYEIDLSQANADVLRGSAATWIRHARTAGTTSKVRRSPSRRL